MTNVAPKVSMDAVALTSTLDLYVGQFKVATYSYANGMITVAQLANNLVLDKEAANTLVAGKRDWITHMFNAGFPGLDAAVQKSPLFRTIPIGQNFVYTDQYVEDANTFSAYICIGIVKGKVGDATCFSYSYDKAAKLTTVFAHNQFVWTPLQYAAFIAMIIRGLDRVNADV